jgi:hypothetical protein
MFNGALWAHAVHMNVYEIYFEEKKAFGQMG